MLVLLLKMAYYVADKVKKKYGSLGHSVLAVQLERGRQGLGLSLAGHKDRSRMAVFVCGLNPNGAASRSGGIQVGDEILEVTCAFLCFSQNFACGGVYTERYTVILSSV
jgi:C-terminal processing protease CtpA/Prc